MTRPFRSRGHEAPPPAYGTGDRVSSDEYLSEDAELSDNDMSVLNTDYSFQRDLTFYPPNQFSLDERQHPPNLNQGRRRSVSDLPSFSEKNKQNPLVFNPIKRPPRDASLRDPQSMSRYDYRLPIYHVPHRNAHAYQYSHPRRRPLIDFIKNEWQHTTSTATSSPTSYNHFETPTWLQVFFAPRFQRSVLAFLLLFFLLWGNWKTWAGSQFDEAYALKQSSKERMKSAEGWFGENMRPEFLDMTQVETLEDHLVPGADGIASGDRRLIIIGDVHGCNDELAALLAEVQYEARTDHIIFTGDMISKGPSSPAVVDLAISARASCVRGNHEDRVLLTYRDLSAHPVSSWKKANPPPPGLPQEAPAPEAEGEEKLPNEEALDDDHEDLSRLDVADRKLARELNRRQIEYLSKCPVILDIGQVPGLGDLHVVHAGLIPGVRLERQDPIGVMHMRTVDLDSHVPSSSGKGTPWFKLWNQYQSLLPSGQRSTVIYGHDSKRGLQLQKFSKGIDTGCFAGGKLSALIIDGSAHEEPKLVSVECKNYKNP